MDKDYGDFQEEDIKENASEASENVPVRVRLPRQGELIGVVVQRLGGNKMEVKATDGKSRNCRVPGRFKRSMWLRPGYFVLIKPWEFDNNKADIIYQYNSSAANQLKRKGLINSIQEF